MLDTNFMADNVHELLDQEEMEGEDTINWQGNFVRVRANSLVLTPKSSFCCLNGKKVSSLAGAKKLVILVRTKQILSASFWYNVQGNFGMVCNKPLNLVDLFLSPIFKLCFNI